MIIIHHVGSSESGWQHLEVIQYKYGKEMRGVLRTSIFPTPLGWWSPTERSEDQCSATSGARPGVAFLAFHQVASA